MSDYVCVIVSADIVTRNRTKQRTVRATGLTVNRAFRTAIDRLETMTTNGVVTNAVIEQTIHL